MYSKEQYIEKIENRKDTISDLLRYIKTRLMKIIALIVIVFFLLFLLMFYKYKTDSQQELLQPSLEQQSESTQNKLQYLLKLYEELENMENYKIGSSYMQIDAYNSNIYTVQYLVTGSKKKIEETAYELYANFIEYGTFKELLEDSIGDQIVNPSEFVELCENNQDEKVNIKISPSDTNILTIKVNTPDEEISKKVIEVVKQSLADYQKTVKLLVGEHELEFVSENVFCGFDNKIQEKQDAIGRSINEKRAQIVNLESQLTSEELSILELERGITNKEEQQKVTQPKRFPFKFLPLLFLVSIFIVVGGYCCYYFMNNKLKSRREITELFDLPCIKIDTEKSEKEVEILCQTYKIENIFISCLEMNFSQDRIGEICSRISGIETKIGGDLCIDTDSIELAKKCQNVILVVKTYSTSYNKIVEILQKCEYLNISVLGVLCFE